MITPTLEQQARAILDIGGAKDYELMISEILALLQSNGDERERAGRVWPL